MLQAFGLMLALVLVVIAATLFFAWRYRATGKALHQPDWDRSLAVEIVTWGIPALIIAILGTMVWNKTHALDPYKPLPGAPPLVVQAIALDWKWLFIYPEQGIATVNEVALPVGRPVTFRLTSEVAMNSFMIPALGGQIYAMAGMETRLNLRADTPGRSEGRNMQFSGGGFAAQTFAALALPEQEFDDWVTKARSTGTALNAASFAKLSKPSVADPVRYYGTVPVDFFAKRIAAHGGMSHHSGNEAGH
ncbi:COX aromatic rich motif-containing protein [Rhodobacteraceae bacterium F11138]|nr:COX aromatic rich motif-containing protein [Rhodobacteraceae bacterium F11138]